MRDLEQQILGTYQSKLDLFYLKRSGIPDNNWIPDAKYINELVELLKSYHHYIGADGFNDLQSAINRYMRVLNSHLQSRNIFEEYPDTSKVRLFTHYIFPVSPIFDSIKNVFRLKTLFGSAGSVFLRTDTTFQGVIEEIKLNVERWTEKSFRDLGIDLDYYLNLEDDGFRGDFRLLKDAVINSINEWIWEDTFFISQTTKIIDFNVWNERDTLRHEFLVFQNLWRSYRLFYDEPQMAMDYVTPVLHAYIRDGRAIPEETLIRYMKEMEMIMMAESRIDPRSRNLVQYGQTLRILIDYAKTREIDMFTFKKDYTYDKAFAQEITRAYHVSNLLLRDVGFEPSFFFPLDDELFTYGGWKDGDGFLINSYAREHLRDAANKKQSLYTFDMLLTTRDLNLMHYERLSEEQEVFFLNVIAIMKEIQAKKRGSCTAEGKIGWLTGDDVWNIMLATDETEGLWRASFSMNHWLRRGKDRFERYLDIFCERVNDQMIMSREAWIKKYYPIAYNRFLSEVNVLGIDPLLVRFPGLGEHSIFSLFGSYYNDLFDEDYDYGQMRL